MERLAPKAGATHRIGEGVPLGRLGTHADIAACAMFLSSRLASYITGAIIAVDGGMSLHGGGMFAQVLSRAFAEQTAER
jgi:NAD(P)-dependent dehydrogenase (short-subunit alcohol dehydrogenase family)